MKIRGKEVEFATWFRYRREIITRASISFVVALVVSAAVSLYWQSQQPIGYVSDINGELPNEEYAFRIVQDRKSKYESIAYMPQMKFGGVWHNMLDDYDGLSDAEEVIAREIALTKNGRFEIVATYETQEK